MSEKINPQENMYDRLYAQTPEGESRYGEPHPFFRRISEHVSSGRIVDLGAGDGRVALFLARQGYRVMAVDNSSVGLQRLAGSAGRLGVEVDCVQADLNEWHPYAWSDGYVISVVLHHLTNRRAVDLLREAQETTRVGGVHALAIFLPEGDIYEGRSDDDRFFPSAESLTELYEGWERVFEHMTFSPSKSIRPDGTPGRNALLLRIMKKV